MNPANPGLCLTDRETEVLELEWGVQPWFLTIRACSALPFFTKSLFPFAWTFSLIIYGLPPICQTLLGPANFVSLKSSEVE